MFYHVTIVLTRIPNFHISSYCHSEQKVYFLQLQDRKKNLLKFAIKEKDFNTNFACKCINIFERLKHFKCLYNNKNNCNILIFGYYTGGLNDVLNDIKLLAADHHIPCVFALSRKVLGKVCRKPVPVSCVGVFNYEGSEVSISICYLNADLIITGLPHATILQKKKAQNLTIFKK